MNKPVFALLIIFPLLTACATSQVAVETGTPTRASLDTQIPLTQTALITSTSLPPIPTDIPTSIVSTNQPGVLGIRRLQMIDANVGWGEGHVSGDSSYYLLRTTDGGETWQDVTPPTGFSSPPWKADITILGIDADTALAFPPDYLFSIKPPYTLVWRTNDGGKSWKASNPVDISDSFLRLGVGPRPQLADKQHAWLTLYFAHRVDAYRLEYRTSDGGVTWEQAGACAEADGPGPGCKTPLFSDAQTGWLSAVRYTSTGDPDSASAWQIQRSQDSGRTWQTITLSHPQKEKECYLSPNRVTPGIAGFIASCSTSSGNTEDYYYLSDDQGKTWQIIRLPGIASIKSRFIFLNMAVGWWISESDNGYRLERTTDGGVTWQKRADGLLWDWEDEYQFADANTGWVVTYNDSERMMELHRTVDGGQTWQKLAPRLLPRDSGRPALAHMDAGDALVFKSIQMVDSLNGWAIGGNEYVFHTADGGRTWQDVTPLSGSIAAGRQFLALDAGHAWTTISGAKGVWSTEDSGKTWQPTNASSIDFTHSGEKIRFRAEPVAEHTLEELVNGSAALAISKTTDGGNTWQPIHLPPMIMNTDEISVDQKAYPGGLKELMQNKPSCGITVQTFSMDTVGLRATCKMSRLIDNAYSYVFILNDYYLSSDSGASWKNWMSQGGVFSWQEEDTPVESEFFLPGGIGWRLKANQLLQTTDGGKTWTVLKAVNWDHGRFDFINPQEGWGIVKSGHVISLVHTIDGGKTWEEIKPLVVNP